MSVDLIWKRTIASQMLPAKLKQTSVIISNTDTDFRASGQIIVFPGYMKIYVEGKDNPDAELANKEKLLPEIVVSEELICSEIVSQIHKTKPPARFTEASLVKEMEMNGIGRPSTFASILDTIVRRGYVEKTKSNLSPTYLGLAITQLLENHFTTLVEKDLIQEANNIQLKAKKSNCELILPTDVLCGKNIHDINPVNHNINEIFPEDFWSFLFDLEYTLSNL